MIIYLIIYMIIYMIVYIYIYIHDYIFDYMYIYTHINTLLYPFPCLTISNLIVNILHTDTHPNLSETIYTVSSVYIYI